MSRGGDPRTADTYDSDGDYNRNNDAYDGAGAGSRLPFAGPSRGWRPTFLGRGESADPETEGRGLEGEDDGWLDEGLIGALLVAGVVLFLIPEPATSMLGIMLIILGVAAFVADALS